MTAQTTVTPPPTARWSNVYRMTAPLDRPVQLAVVGAGARGRAYADLAAHTGNAVITAVADPVPESRLALGSRHAVPPDRQLADWRELATLPRLADAVLVATPDRDHVAAAEALMAAGYDVLLEKPMATSGADCDRLVAAADRAGVFLVLCHVLRYTPYVRALLEVVRSGRIGEVACVQHLEPVGYWHFAHSYVRGNWRNTEESSFLLLAKACHDIDLVTALVGRPVTKVSSFGSLLHFRPDRRPAGAADRCVDCPLEDACAYSAVRLYRAGLAGDERKRYFTEVMAGSMTADAVERALRNGPYGRCVYAGGNDAVDHQVVAMEFDSGATATLTVSAFTPVERRRTTVFGTRGQISGNGRRLEVYDFRTETTQVLEPAADHETADGSAAGGHDGGDRGLVTAFVAALHRGQAGLVTTTASESLTGHRVVFAAERARRQGDVVTL